MYNLKVKLILLQLICDLNFCFSLSQYRRVGFGHDPPKGATYPYTSQVFIKVTLRENSDSTKKSVTGCTGTVIAPRVVLTAGHCFDDKPPLKIECVSICYGQFVRNKNLTKAPASRWIQHPDYNKGVDLGIVVLTTPISIPCKEMVFPEKWEESSKVLTNHYHTKLCGWGRDQANQQDGKIKLNTVMILIFLGTSLKKYIKIVLFLSLRCVDYWSVDQTSCKLQGSNTW